MEGNIVKAATSFGICVIVSTIILCFGLNNFGMSIERAGSNAKASVSVPGRLVLEQSGQLKVAPMRLDVNSGGTFLLGPVEVDVKSGGNRILQ